VRLWRLARWPHRALDGEGGRLYDGRWHSRGTPVIYAASRLSLAALELLAHLDPSTVPADLHAFELELPDEVAADAVELDALPTGWAEPGSTLCRPFGDAWLAAGRTVALQVPSAIVPEESNFLLNPRHPDAARLVAPRHRAFSFDPRIVRRP
jgi:RES domain-containing protein